jgi:hypothetical protein
MEELVDLATSAHGGMAKWNSFKNIKAHLKVGGLIWEVKGKAGLLSDGVFEANIHEQQTSYHSLANPDINSQWDPEKIILNNAAGTVPRTLRNPRQSFGGEVLESQWNEFQPLYFCNYAFWTYLTAPFNFKLPGYQVKELSPWEQDNETWRRLEVTFPEYIQTHNSVQVFYYDKDFLLKRHDYAPDILQGFPSSQYVWDFKDFMGIMVPVSRRIYMRNEDSTYNPEPVMVSIDVLDVEFS